MHNTLKSCTKGGHAKSILFQPTLGRTRVDVCRCAKLSKFCIKRKKGRKNNSKYIVM